MCCWAEGGVMARDPEEFRHLSPSQIMTVLLFDEAAERHTHARAMGARCAQCLDTGMNAMGEFCGCSAGAKIAYQSSGGAR